MPWLFSPESLYAKFSSSYLPLQGAQALPLKTDFHWRRSLLTGCSSLCCSKPHAIMKELLQILIRLLNTFQLLLTLLPRCTQCPGGFVATPCVRNLRGSGGKEQKPKQVLAVELYIS